MSIPRPHWGGVGGGGVEREQSPLHLHKKKRSICFKSNHCYQIQYLIEKSFSYKVGKQTPTRGNQENQQTEVTISNGKSVSEKKNWKDKTISTTATTTNSLKYICMFF